MTESEEELKSLLMRVKEESQMAGLKYNIQKLRSWSHHFTASKWGKSGNSDTFYFFYFLGSTADMKFKKLLVLERKAMTNLDRVLKKNDITLPTKV